MSNYKKLENVLLANPFTVTGQRALSMLKKNLTKEEFLNKCYIEPFTSFATCSYELIDKYTDPDYISDYNIKIKELELKNNKENFEFELLNTPASFSIIKGTAGSGKTTYLNNLLNNKIAHVQICDLENSRKSVFLIDAPFDMDIDYENNTWKFVFAILPQISILLRMVNDNELKHKYDLSKVSLVYNQVFENYEEVNPVVDDVEYRRIFRIIQEYANNEQYHYSLFGCRVREYFSSIFSNYRNNPNRALVIVLGILLRLYCCFSRMDEYKEKRFILAIDNIEFYIGDTLLQDNELQEILITMKEAMFALMQVLFRSCVKYEHMLPIGIIITMRDSTVNLTYSNHFSDEQQRIVDITDWYNFEDIYKRRIDCFSDIVKSIDDEDHLKTFDNILSDASLYKWGLRNLVSMMNNHNHRRIASTIISTLYHTPKDILVLFNRIWKIASTDNNHFLKHLGRKLILRLFLDRLQRGGFFQKLLLDQKDESFTYARRVATYLFKRTINNSNKETYVSLLEIIKSVLQKPYFSENEVSEAQIDNLAIVLHEMNQGFGGGISSHAPLVTIRFGGLLLYNLYTLRNIMKEIYRSSIEYKGDHRSKYDNFAVKINAAGIAYAKYISDFEFFACQYACDSKPLVAINNFNECSSLLKNTIKYVFDNIERSLLFDTIFVSSVGQSKYGYKKLFSDEYWLYKESVFSNAVTHSERVVSSHIGYLNHFLEFINSCEYITKREDMMMINELIKKTLIQYSNFANFPKQ